MNERLGSRETCKKGFALSRTSARRRSVVWALTLALFACSAIGIPGLAADSTSLKLTLDPTTVCAGGAVTCEVTVTNTAGAPNNGTPEGTVDFSSSGAGTFSESSPSLVGGSCTVTYYPSSAAGSPHTISATYVPSSANWAASSDSGPVTVNWCVEVNVEGSDTALTVGDTATVRARVAGISGVAPIPSGTITFSSDAGANGTFSSTNCTLDPAGECMVEYTANGVDGMDTVHRLTASYSGDSNYASESGYFDQRIEKREADVVMTVTPSTAYIFQDVTVTIHVEDDTPAGVPGDLTGETVTLSTDGTGVFEGSVPLTYDATLDANGDCTVTYTPGAFEAGTTTLTATFDEGPVYAESSVTRILTVNLRPTRTIVTGSATTLLVNQVYKFEVAVEDAAAEGTATPPAGTLAYSSYLGADASIVSLSWTVPAPPTPQFNYKCLGLAGQAGVDTVQADYTAADGVHADSMGVFGQGIQRRPTVTTLTNGSSTATGVTCTATVKEHPDNAGKGAAVNPIQGDIVLYSDESVLCSVNGDAPTSCTVDVTSSAALVNVTVKYKPTDRVHLESTASENFERYDQFPPEDDDGTTGAECDDGCGSGGSNVSQMIFDLNAAEAALQAVKMGLDLTALVLDVIPDGVIVGGLIVSTGVTIPYSDIAKAIVAGAGIALDIAIMAMDTDLDDDGLPDVLEENVTGTKPNDWDTDDDGMGDLDEIEEAGGYYGGSRRPDPNNPDSDGDGLLDGDEAGVYNTYFCVADTDCDTVSDGDEVATWQCDDPRNHADPLAADTDGDGLPDNKEDINTSTPCSSCPYVNDDDSDDDGLQDGYEDADQTGTITNTIGNSSAQGSGETDFCLADTDGDGLLDGEEEGQFGASVTPKGVSATVGAEGANLGATVPALDTDMDNDLLSDRAETNTYQTNPTDADTDNDMLSDSFEVATWSDGDARNHSNPREADTDGDGLTDNLEVALGCPFVNDDDSDEDGLQDGWEDRDRNGTRDFTPPWGSTGTVGVGETSFCYPDSDDDGLLDGEEEALFGQGARTAITSTGAVTTVPALDDDSDDDGLSDYEEVHITHTDPLNYDTDNDTLADVNEVVALPTGETWPKRTLRQVSDPLDPDTDDDGLPDNKEYTGTGLDPLSHGTGGSDDLTCPYVNDADSDNDGLQDGAEDANHDGGWSGITLGSFNTQASKAGEYWETDPCNPDTDGDGLLDGEEASLIGGGPISQRPPTLPPLPGAWPSAETPPGFNTVTPEAVSTDLPLGTGPAGSPPGTGNAQLGPYTFTPKAGVAMDFTVPALDTDSDNDGLSDYEEVNFTHTDPLDQDTDNDTLKDSDELVATGGTWPQRTFDQESDPLDINTDDDHLFDPQEFPFPGSGLSAAAGVAPAGSRDTACPFVNDDDSDDDGIQDGKAVHVNPALTVTGSGTPYDYSYTHYEDFVDIDDASLPFPGKACANVGDFDGEQQADAPCCTLNVCDSDSDGDGLNDGEEVALGTNPDDCDTDDDGRNDWHEVTGGGPIPTDPFDPDTDDDGLLDSAEVFGLNPTNPVNADTDGDGLCDGGAGTPWMMTPGDVRVVVNPLCKSCSTPGLTPCAAGGVRAGSAGGIGDHPNPSGYGEDKDGDGEWDGSIGQTWGGGGPGLPETDPNQYDTDGDGDGDGIEVLGFSTSRAYMIPPVDLFGRPITVAYPSCGCLQPLIADTDQDGLEDGYEDRNHDGNFDFLPSEFDHQDPLPGPPIPYPTETNPCDPDTDHDELTDFEERNQRQPLAFYPPLPVNDDGDLMVDEDRIDGIDNDGDGLVDEDPPEGPIELTFNPTNPLDHDTDNDWIYDGPEVHWVCIAIECSQLDNDTDGLINEDPIDGIDNDGDGRIDEDPVDFTIRSIPMLDPTNRDSDSDGFIDGLDDDPCNSECIPVLPEVSTFPIDTDQDGFSDLDEEMAGTHPNDPESHPMAYCLVDLDFDESIDDRIWLEPSVCCGQANSVVIDLDSNVLIDLRLMILPRNVKTGDFDGDGNKDDVRYTVEYNLSNYRVLQPRVLATIDDYNGDLVIDHVLVERK